MGLGFHRVRPGNLWYPARYRWGGHRDLLGRVGRPGTHRGRSV